jgi:hypothetical protein
MSENALRVHQIEGPPHAGSASACFIASIFTAPKVIPLREPQGGSAVSAGSLLQVEMVHGALDVVGERLNGVDHEMVVCPVLPLVPPGEDLLP